MINSPVTILASSITAKDTTIPLIDASNLPNGTNLATIGTQEDAETILYSGKSGNSLTNVTRGFLGTAKSWSSGETVARYFQAYDYDAFVTKTTEMVSSKSKQATNESTALDGQVMTSNGDGTFTFKTPYDSIWITKYLLNSDLNTYLGKTIKVDGFYTIGDKCSGSYLVKAIDNTEVWGTPFTTDEITLTLSANGELKAGTTHKLVPIIEAGSLNLRLLGLSEKSTIDNSPIFNIGMNAFSDVTINGTFHTRPIKATKDNAKYNGDFELIPFDNDQEYILWVKARSVNFSGRIKFTGNGNCKNGFIGEDWASGHINDINLDGFTYWGMIGHFSYPSNSDGVKIGSSQTGSCGSYLDTTFTTLSVDGSKATIKLANPLPDYLVSNTRFIYLQVVKVNQKQVGSISAGSTTLSVVNNAGIRKTEHVTIPGESDPFTVVNVQGNTITLDKAPVTSYANVDIYLEDHYLPIPDINVGLDLGHSIIDATTIVVDAVTSKSMGNNPQGKIRVYYGGGINIEKGNDNNIWDFGICHNSGNNSIAFSTGAMYGHSFQRFEASVNGIGIFTWGGYSNTFGTAYFEGNDKNIVIAGDTNFTIVEPVMAGTNIYYCYSDKPDSPVGAISMINSGMIYTDDFVYAGYMYTNDIGIYEGGFTYFIDYAREVTDTPTFKLKGDSQWISSRIVRFFISSKYKSTITFAAEDPAYSIEGTATYADLSGCEVIAYKDNASFQWKIFTNRNGTSIDDTTINTTKTWSSNKINNVINLNIGSGSAFSSTLYNAKNYDVKGDGVIGTAGTLWTGTNDSTALQTLIQTVYNKGGGIIYLPKGVYMLDEPLLWLDKVSLYGEGVGQTILATRRDVVSRPFGNNRHPAIGFDANGAYGTSSTSPFTNCHFRDFEIDGSDIINMNSYDVKVKGIYLQYLRNCSFRNIYIHDTIATGLGIDFLDKSIIENVVCKNTGKGYGIMSGGTLGGAGIGVGTGGMTSENFIIANCQTDGCGSYGIFTEDQKLFDANLNQYTAQGVIITNCIIKNGRYSGIGIKGGKGITISNCQCYANAQYGIYVNTTDTEELTITNNIIYNNSITGIRTAQGSNTTFFTNFTINNNTIYNNSNYGIHLGGTLTNIFVNNNEILSNNTAIFTNDTTTIIDTLAIRNNLIKNNKSEGIFFCSPTPTINGLFIENNLFIDNSQTANDKPALSIAANIEKGSISTNKAYDSKVTALKRQYCGLSLASGYAITNSTILNNDYRFNKSDLQYSINGNLVNTINDVLTLKGKLTAPNTSATRYVEFTSQLGDFSSSTAFAFEFCFKYTPYTTIIGKQNTSFLTDIRPKGWYIREHGGYLKFEGSTSDAVNVISLIGSTLLTSGSIYYSRITFDGTTLTMSLSTDGIAYTAETPSSPTLTKTNVMTLLSYADSVPTRIGMRWGGSLGNIESIQNTDIYYIKIWKNSSNTSSTPTHQYDFTNYGINKDVYDLYKGYHGITYGGLEQIRVY